MLKVFKYPETPDQDKFSSGALEFGLQEGKSLEPLPFYTTGNNSAIVSFTAVEFDQFRKEVGRIDLDAALIDVDSTNNIYNVDGLTEYAEALENGIYRFEFQNGSDLWITEYFNVTDFVPITELDLEVTAWEQRVISNGGTVSESTLDLVNTLVLGIKSNGLRSRFLRLNLFVGDQFAACQTPLFLNETESTSVFYGNTYDTNNNFVGGDYLESGVSGGLQGNASNKYLDTGFNAFTVTALGLSTGGQLAYSRTQTPTAGGTYIGSNDQNAPASQFRILYISSNTGHALFYQGAELNTVTDARGLALGFRLPTGYYRAYLNGTKYIDLNSFSAVKKPNTSILIFAQNRVGSTPNAYTNALLNCYAITDSIANDTEAATISTLLNDFYTNFSRNEY